MATNEVFECWAVKVFTDGERNGIHGIDEQWTEAEAKSSAKGWNNYVNNGNGATYKPVRVRVTIEEIK